MATSMRFLNVRKKIANIVTSSRSFRFIDSRIRLASTRSLEPKSEDGEDFFGIPENFKLQHVRHDPHQGGQASSAPSVNISASSSPQDNVPTTCSPGDSLPASSSPRDSFPATCSPRDSFPASRLASSAPSVNMSASNSPQDSVPGTCSLRDNLPASQQASSKESNVSSDPEIVHQRNNIISKRRDRQRSSMSFSTTFGSITLDYPHSTGSSSMDTEDLATKAQDILAKLRLESGKRTTSSIESGQRTTSSFESVKHIMSSIESVKHTTSSIDKQKDMHNIKETNAKQVNKVIVGAVSMNLLKPPHNNNAAKSNYFDEFYFPEHSADENSVLLKQTPSLQFSVDYSQSNNPELQNALSKVNNTEESKILRVTPDNGECPSGSSLRVTPDNGECSSANSSNWMDEHFFGTLPNDGSKNDWSKTAKQSDPSRMNYPVTMNDRDFEPHSMKSCHKNVDHMEKSSGVLSEQVSDFNEVDNQYFGNTAQSDNLQKDIFKEGYVPSLNEIVKPYIDPPQLNRNKKLTNDIGHLKQDARKLNGKSGKPEQNNNTCQAQVNMKNKKFVSVNLEDEQGQGERRLNKAEQGQGERRLNKAEQGQGERRLNKAGQGQGERRLNEASTNTEINAEAHVLSNEDFLKMQKRRNMQLQANTSKPETAYDVAMKIRNDLKHGIEVRVKDLVEEEHFPQTTGEEKIESGVNLDSKGFRVLDDQLPDLDKMTSADMVRMLKHKIVFDHEDFLAIDKPYGLSCISQQQDRVSITELLPALAKHLPCSYRVSDLHLVQGLDRDVTGAIILAKNPEIAHMLRGMCKNSDMVIKKFWAITKGVPNPASGLIDIPIGEAKVGNIHKMVLRPRFMKDEKQIGQASRAPSERALTEYKVLSSHLQAALVECSLLTNVKHQMRLHLASGLGTPILGDHKYSNFSKLAPQRLHREMLELLKVRQPKVRNIALHLHCRSIVLKDYKGRMIFLTTHPPSHFRDNMNSLKIRKPNM